MSSSFVEVLEILKKYNDRHRRTADTQTYRHAHELYMKIVRLSGIQKSDRLAWLATERITALDLERGMAPLPGASAASVQEVVEDRTVIKDFLVMLLSDQAAS